MEILYFKTPAGLRKWFAKHHKKSRELLLGYYKTGSGKPSVTWSESVDEALTCGWIDGVRKSIDGERYYIRFTPRKTGSSWSAINVKKVAELKKQGRMLPEGLAAFAARKQHKTGIYSHENPPTELPRAFAGKLKADKKAWAFFQAQIPSYRKAVAWWVISAKKEETKWGRIATLIECSAAGKTVPPLTPRVARKT
jgi:uncharacterized protein YdeI (YjbR/CyaY-like superfamily)